MPEYEGNGEGVRTGEPDDAPSAGTEDEGRFRVVESQAEQTTATDDFSEVIGVIDESLLDELDGDSRFASSVPDAVQGSDLDFIQMTGLTAAPARSGEAVDEVPEDYDPSAPISFAETGVEDVDIERDPFALGDDTLALHEPHGFVPERPPTQKPGNDSSVLSDLVSIVEDLQESSTETDDQYAAEMETESDPEHAAALSDDEGLLPVGTDEVEVAVSSAAEETGEEPPESVVASEQELRDILTAVDSEPDALETPADDTPDEVVDEASPEDVEEDCTAVETEIETPPGDLEDIVRRLEGEVAAKRLRAFESGESLQAAEDSDGEDSAEHEEPADAAESSNNETEVQPADTAETPNGEAENEDDLDAVTLTDAGVEPAVPADAPQPVVDEYIPLPDEAFTPIDFDGAAVSIDAARVPEWGDDFVPRAEPVSEIVPAFEPVKLATPEPDADSGTGVHWQDMPAGTSLDAAVDRETPRPRQHRDRRGAFFLLRAVILLICLVVIGAGVWIGRSYFQTYSLNDPNVAFEHAQGLLRASQSSGDFAAASTAFAKIHARHSSLPVGAQSLFNAAYALYSTPSAPRGPAEVAYGRALVLFEEFIQQYPDHEKIGRAHSLAAGLLFETGSYADAIARISDPMQRERDPGAYLGLLRIRAKSHNALGDLDEAAEDLHAAAQHPDNYAPHKDYETLADMYRVRARAEADPAKRREYQQRRIEELQLALNLHGLDRDERRAIMDSIQAETSQLIASSQPQGALGPGSPMMPVTAVVTETWRPGADTVALERDGDEN